MAIIDFWNLLPRRVLSRPSVQVLRARLDVAHCLKRIEIGPGTPIVGEIVFDHSGNWRCDAALLVWTLAQEALTSNGRAVWMICVGRPRDGLDDLYALAVQADAPIQIHILASEADAAEFRRRWVPSASQEDSRRIAPDIHAVLTQIPSRPVALMRATAVRATMHGFVKQLSGTRPAIAVDTVVLAGLLDRADVSTLAANASRLIAVGDPLALPRDARALGDTVIVRKMGLSLLEELAMLRACDGYIGACDHNAVIAGDAGIPCLLASNRAVEYGGRIRCTPDVGAAFDEWTKAIAHGALPVERCNPQN